MTCPNRPQLFHTPDVLIYEMLNELVVFILIRLNCLDVSLPRTIDTVLYRLIGRAQVRIDLEGSFRFLQKVFGSLELILYSNLRNSQNPVDSRNIPLDLGHQIFSC